MPKPSGGPLWAVARRALADAKTVMKPGVFRISPEDEERVERFLKAVVLAAPPEAVEADCDPHRLARLYADAHWVGEVRALAFWRGEYYRWDGTAYRPLPEEQVRAELVGCLKAELDRLNVAAVREWAGRGGRTGPGAGRLTERPSAHPVTTRLVADVMQSLASVVLLPAAVRQPSWLGPVWDDGFGPYRPDPAPAPGHVLACRNALVPLPALAAGVRNVLRPTPRFFSANALDYDYDPQAGPPREWLGFLRELFPGDRQARHTLQEWFGYCLTQDTAQQKILMLVGPKRSGKGTIARVLRGLVGADNTAGPTLASLGTNFGLQPLLGKSVAVVSDARLSGRTDIAVVTERLLSISGEDALTVDRKFLPQVTARLPVRFVVLTNELPRLNDTSGALAGRMLLLRLTESWYGREDVGLAERLLGELPGILLWAVKGWRRLRWRGHFEQPDSGRELLGRLGDIASPIGVYLRERCEVGPGYRVLPEELYGAWCEWCQGNGQDHPGLKTVFARDLHAALPSLTTKQVRVRIGPKSVPVRYHFGLKLRGGLEGRNAT